MRSKRAFQGVLVDTLLGNAISLQVHGGDLAAALLTIALAGISVAELYLNLRERAAELVTLRTVGWGDRHLVTLVLFEALGLGLLGSASGGLVGVALGALVLHFPAGALALAAAITALGGVLAALLASLVPLAQFSADDAAGCAQRGVRGRRGVRSRRHRSRPRKRVRLPNRSELGWVRGSAYSSCE